MTTVAPKRSPQQPKPQHSDLQFGPVSAAIVTSAVTLFLTTAGKLTGIPPWVAVIAGVVMTGALVWAGKQRRPRPLSRRSVIFRAVVALTITGWVFYQLAVFPDADGAMTGLIATTVAVMLLPAGGFAVKFVPGPWKLLPPVITLAVAMGLLGTYGLDLIRWVSAMLTTTDPLPVGDFGRLLPWLGYSTLSLVMIAAPMAVLGVVFANQEQAADDELRQARRDLTASSTSAKARAMQRLLCNEFREWTEHRDERNQVYAKTPNLITSLETIWDNGGGETYLVDLSHNQNGTTISRLNSAKENLVTKLNLPDGCGIEVVRAGEHGRGFARVEVSRVNMLKRNYSYPDLLPRSILNPLPVGVLRRGVETGAVLRESSAYLWGQKGSGKTVTIYDIICGAIQCTDCLVWGIDLNGGAAFAPFLAAWEEGRTDRPVIDWVATDITEVAAMAQVGLDIAVDRKVFYRKLKKEHNTNLMPVGNGAPGQPPPEILIIIDEGAEVLGYAGPVSQMDEDAKAARDAMDAIMRLARDAAVNIVFSGLRATSDVADPAFKAGTAVRIGMRVTDAQELAYGFGDWKLDPADIPYQGCGFICNGHEDETQAFKAYFLDPQTMDRAGEVCTPWRPFLDERGIQIGGRVYADRWRRTAHKIWSDPRPELLNYGGVATADAGPAQPPAAVHPAGATATAVDTARTDRLVAGLAPPVGDGDFESLMATAARQRAPRPEENEPAETPAGGGGTPEQPEPDDDDGEARSQEAYNQHFAEIARNMTVGDPRTWPGAVPIPPDAEIAANPHTRDVLERLVKMHGPKGIGWTAMHRKLVSGGDWGPAVEITAVSMGKALKKIGSDDEPVEWLAERKERAPYVHRDCTT